MQNTNMRWTWIKEMFQTFTLSVLDKRLGECIDQILLFDSGRNKIKFRALVNTCKDFESLKPEYYIIESSEIEKDSWI